MSYLAIAIIAGLVKKELVFSDIPEVGKVFPMNGLLSEQRLTFHLFYLSGQDYWGKVVLVRHNKRQMQVAEISPI